MRNRFVYIFSILLLFAVSSCSSATKIGIPNIASMEPSQVFTQNSLPTPTNLPLNENILKNLSYPLPESKNGSIQLMNGQFEESIQSGSASKLAVTLLQTAFGDLNMDGLQDAAVILAYSTGGSGIFHNLYGVIATSDGQLQVTAPVFLGDRIKISTFTIQNGRIDIDMIQAGPNDPLCCPTQRVLLDFSVVQNNLVLNTQTTPTP